MARLLLVLTLIVVGGLFIYRLSGHLEYVADSYDTDNVMKMIENLEAPAAGGDR